MFLVIPIAQNDSEFFVVLVRFVRRMQNKGCTKAVDILTLIELRNAMSLGGKGLANALTDAWA